MKSKVLMKSVCKFSPILFIWLSAYSIYMASLAINHSFKELETVMPTASSLLVSFSKLRGPYILAACFSVVLLFCQLRDHKYFKTLQVIFLGIMLLYSAYAILAVSLPLTCLCDEWKSW